jgi:lipid-A-disaccharide synthase
MQPICVVAGENSGDSHGAGLVRQFKKRHPSTLFFGIGGEKMKAAGVELLYSVSDLSVMGLFELISHLPRLKKIFDRIKKEVRARKPSAILLIDSPDFNLRLAKALKREAIPVLYYISPTVWAWRKGRLKTIKRFVDRMMLIFPFEEAIYKESGIEAVYIGHPLCESMHIDLTREVFLSKYGLAPDRKIICLMPGSRMSEIKYHMPILMQACQKLEKAIAAEFLLLLAESLREEDIRYYLPNSLIEMRILKEDRYEAMAYSDLILAACGTANLEAALLETPFITFYRISSASYKLGLPFVKTRTYSIVNILSGREIVPELIQNQFTAENLLIESRKILESNQIRKEMLEEFRGVRAMLGTKKASEDASAELEKILGIHT